MAACAVAEIFHIDDEMKAGTGGLEIKSENNDGYSVNYVTDGPDGKPITAEKKAYKAAYPYLIHTGLMYRGW
nr:MAG TPA: Head Tail Connector Protein [Caudoviricetes sp.]